MSLLPKAKLMPRPLRLLGDRSGQVAIMFALMLTPFMIALGAAIDYARAVQARYVLQSAVDAAALAGAAAFIGPGSASNAQTVATNYFKAAILPNGLTVGSPSVTTNTSGTINPALGTANAYTVTVSASGTLATTFLYLVYHTLYVSASGTAGNPVITPQLEFTNVNSQACDGNTVYLYQVPKNTAGTGYNYGAVPTFSVATSSSNQGNYYEIGTSYSSPNPLATMPPGQALPTFNVNQPLGVMLRNDTNGNTGNPSCGAAVTGANSYGAPNGGSQAFYSSLLGNAQSPSQNTNYSYTVKVTSTTSHGTTTITAVSVTLPPSILYPSGTTITEPIASGSYNTLATYLGINAPSSGYSNCSSSVSGSVTTYSCSTQYRTAPSSSSPNCSLYIQTGVTQNYINGLSNSSTAPAAAVPNCSSLTGGGAQFAAPTCAQISALASGSGSSAIAPATVFWWDDAGGVGPGEQYYGPASHCTGMTVNGPGYGEDCQYKNNYFAMNCNVSGGSGSGLTEVVLTQ